VIVGYVLATTLENNLSQVVYVHRHTIRVIANKNMRGFRGPLNQVAQSEFIRHRRRFNKLMEPVDGEVSSCGLATVNVVNSHEPVRFSLTLLPKFELRRNL
jgi:hypothetical protein